MSLRTKFIAAITLINIIMMAIVFFVTQNILLNNAKDLEIQQATNAIMRTTKIIQEQIDTVAKVAIDYAVWDDTYNFISSPNQEYLQSNYLDQTLINNNIDVVSIYDQKNQQLFYNTTHDASLDDNLQSILQDLLGITGAQTKSGIYVDHDKSIYYFATHRVSTSAQDAESNGLLVMLRKIDNSETNIVNEQAGRIVNWLPHTSKNSIYSKPQMIIAEQSVPTSSLAELSIQIEIPRELTVSITQARNQITAALLLVTLLSIIGIYAFINTSVIRPVNSIVNAVRSINSLTKHQQYIQINTQDEFEHLAIEINRMLQKLKKSQDQVVAAQSEIAKQRTIEEKKDEFFFIASHELRTPLTAIRGNIEYLQTAFPDIIAQHHQLNESLIDMHTASMRLIELVNDFLTTSKLDKNRMTPNLATYDIYQTITTSIQDLVQLAKHNQLQLNVIAPAIPLTAQFDPNFMQEILQNLVGNSIKFTPAGGKITIETKSVDNHVHIIITDTGRGIPLSEQQELFQQFRQATHHPLTRDTTKGTGLGLYISRKMAQAMNGDVQLLQSESEKGSVFLIIVPKA